MNWTHEIITPEDGDDPIEFERLSIGDWIDLEIIHVDDDRFFIQATDDCNGEIEISRADTLDAAKKFAERWALAQIATMLQSLGAEGIWLVRGVDLPELKWLDDLEQEFSIRLEHPHERILLARFPAGDGGEAGIEHF